MKVPKGCFVAENSKLIGDIELGERVSVWYNVVIRSDEFVKIGDNCNIQDGAIIHSDKLDVIIGNNSTIGHGAVIDDSKIGNNCLIGMNASVFESEIADENIVAAGAVVNKMKSKKGVMLAGVPAVIKKSLDEKNLKMIKEASERYLKRLKK